MNRIYKVIGLMSGTSLDGLDLAACEFFEQNNAWNFEVKHAQTIPYSVFWREKLANLENQSALEYCKTDVLLGEYFGQEVQKFIAKTNFLADFVASHGHTIFHQPAIKLTAQIGKGSAIAAACNLPVICDFRTTDVALGGQGAPLVPIGDRLLFAEYDYCLNIGGIANISFEDLGKRIAYDICPANMVLNTLIKPIGKEFDENGNLAKSGDLNRDLLEKLNNLSYYHQKFPKSMGKEWVLENIYPVLNAFEISLADQMHTFTHHIAFQIAKQTQKGKLLATGGGALNTFLTELIEFYNPNLEVQKADFELINFKEAIIFAFLGVLRFLNRVNVLQSVTGSKRDNYGGIICC